MKSQVSADSSAAGGAFLPLPFRAVLEGPAVDAIDGAERELRRRAATDENRCAGFFPTLSGVPGIESDFPSCRDLMRLVPKIEHESRVYRFNFIRLSLVCQASQPACQARRERLSAVSSRFAGDGPRSEVLPHAGARSTEASGMRRFRTGLRGQRPCSPGPARPPGRIRRTRRVRRSEPFEVGAPWRG